MDEIFADFAAKLRDPNRRWLRHTYQEGPGFRFLATRGGRPPLQDVPRASLDTVRQRARVLRTAREEGLAAALDLGGCSRMTLWRWQHAYAAGGLAALLPERHGPRQPVTNDLGTARPSLPRQGGPRYERSSPNSLWHIDLKGPFFIQLGREHYLKTWIFGLVDDHSRYVLGLRIATRREVAGILVWLRDCIELCGRPLDLMSDNGVEFVHWIPGVLTRFGKTLRELQIRQIKTQLNSPWTNGKIESFWATLKSEVLDRQVFRSIADAEAALDRFASYYNYHRLHGEIGWLTPGERFDGTPFTDRGFDNIPALAHLVPWLEDLRAAA